MHRCSSVYTSTSPTRFHRCSPKTDSPYEPYSTQQVSSSRIAFAKSQTFTLAEVQKFRENASTLLEPEESVNLLSSESPRVSADYCSEVVMERAVKPLTQSRSNQAWRKTSLDDCSLCLSCNDSDAREQEVSEELLPESDSSQKLSSMLSPRALSPLSEGCRRCTCSEYSDSDDYDRDVEYSKCSECSECSECDDGGDDCCKSDYDNQVEYEQSVSDEYDATYSEDRSPTYDSMTPEQSSPPPPRKEEDEYSDLAQLKHNLATRLCFNIMACSCQIWLIQNEFMSLVTNNIAVITRALVKKEYEDFRSKMKSLNAVVEVPMDKVEGRVGSARVSHCVGFGRGKQSSASL